MNALCIVTVVCFGITSLDSARDSFIVNMHTFSIDNIFIFLVVGVLGSGGQALCLMLLELIIPLSYIGKRTRAADPLSSYLDV